MFNRALKKPLMRLWLEEGEAPVENILTGLFTSQKLNLVAVDEFFVHLIRNGHPTTMFAVF